MTDIIVGSTQIGVVIESTKLDSIVNTPEISTLSTPEVYNVVVQVESSNTLVAGYPGPKGEPGIREEDVTYSKRVDFVSDSELYKGEASVGSSESAPVWRVRKVLIGADGDVTEIWASGTDAFDKVWADRISLIYS
jgi:hypothetical protein